ncbi:MAG: FAD-dependent monooxygenase [Sciscionella sp.]|nr:FAD-dependent monooxygenase [Sciscionella sp.]
MYERTAIVVGGGIGGLAAAIALRRVGWRVHVFEQAPEFTEVGAGILVWPNGLRALHEIGLAGAVRALGTIGYSGGIQSASGRWLVRTSIEALERAYGPCVLLTRSALLRVLLGALPRYALHTDVEVQGVRVHRNKAIVEYDGGSESADIVIGADGLHSVVRASTGLHASRTTRSEPWTAKPHYVGYTAWRMITEVLPFELNQGAEVWGKGERFGYAALPGGAHGAGPGKTGGKHAYCYATARVLEGGTERDIAMLRERFAGWPDPIPALLASTTQDAVLRHDLYRLPSMPSFVRGRVALLGDAAHAMPPDLGQGACQALEDAAVLGNCLASGDPVIGLANYDKARRHRAQWVANHSTMLGVIGQTAAPPLVWLRDIAVGRMSERSMIRQLRKVLNWQP